MREPATGLSPWETPLSGTRVLGTLLLGIAIAVAATVALTAAWSLVLPALPEGAPAANVATRRLGLARFARSALFFTFLAAYWALLRRSRGPFLQATGFVPARRVASTYAAGFLAGALPVVALIGVLVFLSAMQIDVRGNPGRVAWLAAKAVLLGFVLSVLEEGLFRGLVQGDLARAFGNGWAIVAGAAFFAATHFLGVSDAWRAVPDPAPGAGAIVVAVFSGLGSMVERWPELLGLFLVGVILAIIRIRTGALWLGMGMHAGWYWVKTMDRWFVRGIDSVVEANRPWLGTSQYLDGVAGWVALLAILGTVSTIRWNGSRSPGSARVIP